MSLPDLWVDRIFARLALTYGQRFLGLYAGLNLDAVKADWADQLARYESEPGKHAIAFALENLPSDHPPTVLQFRDLCRRAPSVNVQVQLPAPKPDPAGAAKVREAIQPLKSGIDPRAWIKALQKREAGQNEHTPSRVRLTQFQREAWREGARAIGLEVEA